MPFLEFLGGLILFVIAIVVIVYGSILVAGLYLAIGGVLFVVGWIPIFMAASDGGYEIGRGFLGVLSYFSMWVYTLAAVGYLTIAFIRPDPDGIPPGFRLLSLFSNFETVEAAKATAKGDRFNAKAFFAGLRSKPRSLLWSRIERARLRKESEKLTEAAARAKAGKEAAELAMKVEICRAEEAESKRKREILERKLKALK